MKGRFNQWQRKWLKALESGEYAKATGALCTGKGFCCLGVACEVLGMEAEKTSKGLWRYGDETEVAPDEVMEKMMLRDDQGTVPAHKHFSVNGIVVYGLADANDKGVSHKEIAKIIRRNPKLFFTNF